MAQITSASSRMKASCTAVPLVGVETGVIRQRPDPQSAQVLRSRVRRRPGEGVDDSALTRSLQAEASDRLSHPDLTPVVLALLDHVDVQVGPEKGTAELHGVRQSQLSLDVPGHLCGGGGSQRQHRHAESRLEAEEVAIRRSKVVTPLTDAMRLIDGDEA